MYEKILLPVDEETESSELLHHASEIAHWADAEVELLYVANTNRDSVTLTDRNVVDVFVERGEGIVEEAGEVLDSLGVEYSTDVVQGVPAETIVDYAERYEFDLVAMPTQGRAGLSRYLLGSVTEKVVRLSSVPVLTARGTNSLEFPYESLLVPTDGSESATRAAEHAVAFADALDATVHALSATDNSLLANVEEALGGEATHETATAAVDSVVEIADGYGVEQVETHVESGAPDEVIREYIDVHDIGAVVMGTTGRSGIDRVLLGSVAEKTVRSAPVPVITVGGA
jgi:nucleotide-binding universal stress UspA family protein